MATLRRQPRRSLRWLQQEVERTWAVPTYDRAIMRSQGVRVRASWLLRVIVLALLSSAPALHVNACTCACARERTVAEHVEKASGVVVAELVEMIDQTDTIKPNGEQWSSSCGGAMLRLKVRDVLKGEFPRDLFVRRSAIGTSCDVGFQLQDGGIYLLFLSGEQTGLALSECSSSQAFDEKSPVLAAIRAYLAQANNGNGVE